MNPADLRGDRGALLNNTLMMRVLTGNNYIKTVCDYNTLFCRPARLRGSDYFFLITPRAARAVARLHWATTLSPTQVGRDPLIGNIFENLIVAEILKTRLNAGLRPNLFFFRDSNGFEIDLIIEEQRRPMPIEIKSALTFTPALTKNLRAFNAMVPDAHAPALIYAGDSMGVPQGVQVLNFTQAHTVAGTGHTE